MTTSTKHIAARVMGLIRSLYTTTLAAGVVALVPISAGQAHAAMVSGVYAGAHDAPLADRQLHFDNLISGDIFLARTASDGSFSAELPPGNYDLRAEHGLVIKSQIIVSDGAISLGRVSAGTKLKHMTLGVFEGQGLAPALVGTAAPATAHVAESADGSRTSAASDPAQSAATFYKPDSPPAAPAPH